MLKDICFLSKKTAFTLIELLVVIAIVGILSGLIIVGMSSSVDSARIAKAQIFSASLRDSLLMSLVSEWKFDELTTATEAQSIQDTWNANNCTLYTGTDGLDKIRAGSNCVYGKCLAFDGTNDYLDCGSANNLNLTQAFTIESWLNPNVITSVSRPWFSKGSFIMTRITSSWQTSVYYYLMINGVQQEGSAGFALTPNQWNLLTETYDSQTHYLKFYLNGVLKSTTTTASPYVISDNQAIPFYVARYGGEYFNASIDNFRIYNAAIPASQIREQYYAGLNKLLAKGEITKEDYQNRLNE